MPNRPREHVTGDLVRAEVQRLGLENGWACDVVQSDYGEDLLIQTQLDGKMDPFRMWIQVKGTEKPESYKLASGDFSYPVSVDLALKWIRSREIILFVLWDLTQKKGYWVLPRSAFDPWQVYQAEGSVIQIRIQASRVFDREQARDLSWSARIDHYTVLLREGERRDELMAQQSTEPVKSNIPLITVDLLDMLDIIDQEGLSEQFKTRLLSGVKKLRLENPGQTPRQTLFDVILLATLNAMHDRHPNGCLTTEVLRAICNGVIRLLREDSTLLDIQKELLTI